MATTPHVLLCNFSVIRTTNIWMQQQFQVFQNIWKGEQNSTAHYRGLTKSIKNILKTIKLIENANIQKVIALHWRKASDTGLVNALKMAKQIKLAHRPICRQCSLWPWPETGAGGATFASPLESPDMSMSFFARQLQKGTVDLPYTHTQWFQLQLVENNNCQVV